MSNATITLEQFKSLKTRSRIARTFVNDMIVSVNKAVDLYNEKHDYQGDAFADPAIAALQQGLEIQIALREELHKEVSAAREILFPNHS